MVEQLEPLTMLTGVAVEADATSYIEGQTAWFTFTLDQPAPQAFYLDLMLSGGPAGPTGYVLPISQGETTVHVDLPTTDNSTSGDSYTLNLAITGSSEGGPAGPFNSASTNILDNDYSSGSGGSGGGGSGPSGPGGGGSGPSGPSGPTSISFNQTNDANEGTPFQVTGTISPPGYYSFVYYITSGYGNFQYDYQTGNFSVMVLIDDDGPSPPGDETPKEETHTLIMSVWSGSGPAVSEETTVTVHNVDPRLIDPYYGDPQDDYLLIDIYDYPAGGPNFEVSGYFLDDGEDTHVVTIDWGDDTEPTVYVSYNQAVSGSHRYEPDGNSYTITVMVEDDDTGVGVHSEVIDMYLLDLDNDADNDEDIDEYDDPIEHFEPGQFIVINNDDDNENEVSDMLEDGPIENENDLVPMLIRWEPTVRPYPVLDYTGWHVVLTLDPEPSWDSYELEYNSVARLYTSADKSGYVPFEDTGFYGFPAISWPADEAFTTTLYVEARSLGEFRFQLELREPGWGVLDTDPVVFTAVDPGIDAFKILLNDINGLLPEEIEETIGAYLPVNNDFDKYESYGAMGLGSDKDKPGPVDPGDHAEDDLLPILLTHVAAGGHYTFNLPTHFKIWKDFERTQLVTGATQIAADGDASERMLFVEALSRASGLVSVNYKVGTRTVLDIDRIRVTAFEWAGPLNVPAFSKYTYEAVGGVAGEGESKWLSPIGGSLVGSFDHQGIGGMDEGDVLWHEGATVGYAVYQAQANYVWRLNVNIVKVVIETPPSAFTTGAVADGGTGLVQDGRRLKFVKTADGDAAFRWAAQVTLIGPGEIINGVQVDELKGVEWLEVGFIQNVVDLNLEGFYGFDPGRYLHSSMNDDTPILDVHEGSHPYYIRDGNAMFFGNGQYPPPFGQPNLPGKSKLIYSNDSPGLGVPLTFDLGATVEAGDQVLDFINPDVK